ncbi:hypothetical protein Gbth_044_014 [Gluconobacter thailandicus F149-1 = NBRC 100600]|uniref:hypothetical protein n=1 Tax=Gluconobacter thailandicus TaxID=257438 RepID=UPI000559674C|nr:hypothetical protein [Gluconobacter thailandicus]KXV53642.1 hypothetical protein AD946_07105 [Gluconobacter thailandicus]GAN94057.1 hypothetical protein Gbth_044_014 [Gluconobacter thailandicus F149-1 = NBRC 100600]GBR58172.1 hypothetical protein AA100600_0648 [Gluconobacter thailandicus F149-1 = NBRC 100600]GEL87638.1 hypothetical protein GTH01_19960 [Gluconobacter thailandicus F149-1 = NBRC 100600]
MSDFKSGVLSIKPTESDELKIRLSIPEKHASAEAGRVSTPEFKISVVLPKGRFSLDENFFTTEKETLKLLGEAIRRRITEITVNTGM